jgi:SlyX protein
MDPHDTAARLLAAEEQIAHLTRALDDLSDVLAAQGGEVDRLSRRLALLLEREAEREVMAGGTVPLADQKPPHY